MKRIGLLVVIAAFVLGLIGCSKDSEPPFIADNVISNAMIAAANPLSAYSAEIELKETGADHAKEYLIKEWVSQDGKRRTETQLIGSDEQTITVFTGRQYLTYLPNMNQVLLYRNDVGFSDLSVLSPSNQTIQLLGAIQNTHELTAVGEEKVSGRDTFHVSAKAAESDESSTAEQKFWIDQEDWLVLKLISDLGNIRTELEFKELELEPELSADLFQIEFPEDVVIIDLDRLDPEDDEDESAASDDEEESVQ